ncbi:MAG: hypothetical protein EP315_07255 [Gammaproteobacteria bacterium]|nr:MAG: hypothetical protein EP315_07255 [Gammaproteobacteria bacterium]
MGWLGIGIRYLIALLLVFLTYNPEGYSFIDWVFTQDSGPIPLKIFAGVILIIGWAIYIRATRRSLGMIGIALAVAFFATLLWLLIDLKIIPTDSVRAVTYMVLFIIASLLATGMCWSHIRRRLSGQMDVDEIEG